MGVSASGTAWPGGWRFLSETVCRLMRDEAGADVLENVALLGFVTLPIVAILIRHHASMYDGLYRLFKQVADLAYAPGGDGWGGGWCGGSTLGGTGGE